MLDYDNMRAQRSFNWNATILWHPLLEISGISVSEYTKNPKAGVEVFSKKNRKRVYDMFEGRLREPAVSCPPISYGHLNSIGIDLVFPEGNGEVNYVHNDLSMDECIALFDRDIDYAKTGYVLKQMEYQKILQEAYPGESVGLAFAAEGPITEAYFLRDINVYMDPYDQPEKLKILLDKICDSVFKFKNAFAEYKGPGKSFTIYDDCAAQFSPWMWPEFVLPYWEKYFKAYTNDRRGVHCEDMKVEHLKFLEQINMTDYDPRISPALNPENITANTRVPFSWFFAPIYIHNIGLDEVEDFVFKAVADGASTLFTHVSADMIDDLSVKKVLKFIDTCETVKDIFKKGGTRCDLLTQVSEKGKIKFWSKWPK